MALHTFIDAARAPLSADRGLARLAASVLVLAATWYCVSAVRAWHRLRHVPGPFVASFSYLWIGRATRSGQQTRRLVAAAERYGGGGTLVRIGPNDLMTADPAVVRRINGAQSRYRRAPWYQGIRFNPYCPTMFTRLDPRDHDRLKARVAAAYAGRETDGGLEAAVDAQVRGLVDLVRREYLFAPGAGAGRYLDLGRVLGFLALDVISALALGRAFGCCRLGRDPTDFFATLNAHLPLIALTQEVPWIRNIVFSELGLQLAGPRETDRAGIGKLMRLANETVRERWESGRRDEKDMLSSFINRGLTRTECEVETLFMFVAGSDTTAAVMRITLFHIISAPPVYARLKAEMAAAVRDGRASRPITNAEARELPYLQATIYEGLRMRPVGAGLFYKEVPPEGDTIDGLRIPGGTWIGVNQGTLLRSPALFGEDADGFRPERFLEAGEAARAEMRRHVELVFGYGRWMCAGKPVAFMELNKVFFELLRAFDFQLRHPQKPMVSVEHSLPIDYGFIVKVTEAEPLV